MAVLGAGIVFLYRSFFSSLDAAVYARDRLNAMVWIDAQIQRDNELLSSDATLTRPFTTGRFVFEGRDFNWTRSLQSYGQGFYDATVSLAWKAAGRHRQLDVAASLCPLKTITYAGSSAPAPPIEIPDDCS